MDAATVLARPYRPPAPIPLVKPLNTLGLLMGLRENPVATWGIWHFEQEITQGTSILGHLTVISAPEGVRHVMVDNAANYVKDDLQRRVLKPGLGEGLLTVEGDAWRRARRTMAPIFSPRAVDGFAQAMLQCAQASAARLESTNPGQTVDIAAETTRLTFEVLTKTLFSDAIETSPDRFAGALTTYFENLGRINPLDLVKAPDWIPRIGQIRARPAIAFFEEQVKKIVALRQSLVQAGKPVPRDLLTLLLEAADPETGEGLTETEIGANIITFIGAGHETTANSLQWTLFLLAKHPDIRARVEAEADGAEAFALNEWPDRLPMIRAALEEAMRLYPPAATLTRAALADDEVMGKRIPKGTTVVISPWLIHRHRRLWSEPDLFRPERFLPGNREKIDRFAYLPFGAGPRVCIGQRFSVQEMVVVLAVLLKRLRFAMPPGASVQPVQRITLRPSPKLEMLVTRR